MNVYYDSVFLQMTTFDLVVDNVTEKSIMKSPLDRKAEISKQKEKRVKRKRTREEIKEVTAKNWVVGVRMQRRRGTHHQIITHMQPAKKKRQIRNSLHIG
jgi:hypothetical protein